MIEKSDINADLVMFHGPKDLNVRVDVSKDSTAQGELLPAPWGVDGQVSELYLLRGGKYEEYKKKTGANSEIETIKVLRDPAKLGSYIENLTQADRELKRLHASHIPQESKTLSFESIMQRMGSDETIVAKVACKALINAPATGYDIVSDLVVVMTRIVHPTMPSKREPKNALFTSHPSVVSWCGLREPYSQQKEEVIKSDTSPGGYQRRIYFFHVRSYCIRT